MARAKKRFSKSKLVKAEKLAVYSAILFAIGVAISMLYVGVGDVWGHIKALPAWLWGALILSSAANMGLRGYRWPLFVNKLGLKVPLKRIWLYYLSGNAMVVTPGKFGAVLRLWFLQKGHGIPYRKTLPLMMMDPITDLAALLLIVLFGKLAVPHMQETAIFVFGAVFIGAVALMAWPKLLLMQIKLMYRLFGKRGKRFFAVLQKIARNLTQLVSPIVFLQAVILSFLGWMAVVWAFQYVLMAMGHDVSLSMAAFIYALPIIIGGASMMPGGLGAAEASMLALLALADVPLDAAVAAVAVIRFITLWGGVGVGFSLLPLAVKKVS